MAQSQASDFEEARSPRKRGPKKRFLLHQCGVAPAPKLATSTRTPGPMVEDTETLRK
jgi:hypothetical protein